MLLMLSLLRPKNRGWETQFLFPVSPFTFSPFPSHFYDPLSSLVEIVTVVVNFYSASCRAANALNVPLCRKMMSLQRRSEAVGTPSMVPE